MAEFTRIFSDIHYGDRSSQVRSLAQLTPLLDGPAAVVLNGDTLDTRLGPAPERTWAMREEVLSFFPRLTPGVTFLTGNHDADLTAHHALEFARGAVWVTHGDILYDDIVPWSQDVPLIKARLAEEFAKLPPNQKPNLETRLAIFRRVAMAIPQRHQSEPNVFKYAADFARDTVWPPSRFFRIIQAWRQLPARAAALAHEHRLQAKFMLVGHTHRPGIWRGADGRVVINTGSFSRPFGSYLVDLAADRLLVRRIDARRGEFRPGAVLAEFALAEG